MGDELIVSLRGGTSKSRPANLSKTALSHILLIQIDSQIRHNRIDRDRADSM